MGNENVSRPCNNVIPELMSLIYQSYDQKNKVAGILYFHRISDGGAQSTELLLRHMTHFQDSWGEHVLPQRVLLVLTVQGQVGEQGEERLRSVWGPWIAFGTRMTRFEHTPESAWRIVDQLQQR